jgi:hypothetical protein
MDATSNIATDLFYKIRSRFTNLKLGESSGEITINPEDARFFDFDYTENDKVIGHVSISLAEASSMKIYFSSGITEGMDDGQKEGWYKFLREMRLFAKRRLMSFDTRDVAKDMLDQRDYAFLSQHSTPTPVSNDTITKPVGEGMMNESNMYGTKTQSYQKLLDTRLIIKHNKTLEDDSVPGARTRNIGALFVENEAGERFKYPFVHLAGARAMQRHVANGGLPYDNIGKSIIKMSEEIAQLKNFSNYVVRNDLMNSDNNSVVERSATTLEELKNTVKRLAKQSHYEAYVENFVEADSLEIPEDVVEQYTEQFTVKNFKEDIKDVFPILYRLMQEQRDEDLVGYNDIVGMTEGDNDEEDSDTTVSEDPFDKFENWAMGLGEDSPIQLADEGEKEELIRKLNKLVGEHFPAGIDGKNAINSLKGIIEDPKLDADIKMQAQKDPDGCVRGLVKAWIEENDPETLDKLDFGDYVDEPAVGADEVEPPRESMETEGMDPAKEKEVMKLFTDFEDKAWEYGAAGRPDLNKAMELVRAGELEDAAEEVVNSYSGDDGEEVSALDDLYQDLVDDLDFVVNGNTEGNKFSGEREKAIQQGKKDFEVDGKKFKVQEVAEFINSFYDRDSGTFPKGPEGVCTMVGKKFGEQAEMVARKFVERMAPHQEQGAEYVEAQAEQENSEVERIKKLSGL